MNNFVVELSNNLPVSEVGGKSYSLSMLLNNDFNVPQGFVVTSSAFFGFLRNNDLAEKIQKLALEIIQDNFKEKSAKAREMILKGEIPEGISSEIDRFLYRLDSKYVSVRSSAVSEDSLKSSFAGLFDTFLNIKRELRPVLESVKKCWASLFNERAVAYRIKKGFPHLEGMAIIIQEMIPAEICGITFTLHPIDKKSLLVEASYGIGNMIVSGRVEPDDYVINKETLEITEKKIGKKDIMSIVENDRLKVVNVGRELKKKPVLSDDSIIEIAKISLKVEKIFNYPQDIEWCILNNKLWLLQSRDVTGVIR
jgi:pyruvate,water dikinase